LYVDDVVEANILCATNLKEFSGEVYNVGGRVEWEMDIKQYSDIVLKVTGKDDSLVEYKDAEAFTTTIKNQDFISNLRQSLHKATKNDYKYNCNNCGYKTIALSWQCPTCRSWESGNPINFIS
jgi:nucleoside-diphosphate-sugar epimerase